MIPFKSIRVLLADGKDRQTLPMAQALKKLGCKVTTINASKLDNGFASKYPDEKLLEPSTHEHPKRLVKMVEGLLRTGKYDVVISTSDLTAELLSQNKKRLEQYAKIAVVEPELFELAYDKLNTMKICMEQEIPCPKTLTEVHSVEEIIRSDLQFPIVLKPRKSFGSIGFRRIDDKEKLLRYCSEQALDLSAYLVQEYIPQDEIQYVCSMFVDQHNKVKSAVVFSKNRWFPVDGGTSTLNVTVDRPDIVESCTKLLQTIGWRGSADLDLIEDPRDGKAKILEINPRPSGCVKICFEAGVDLSRQMLELAFDEEVTSFLDYQNGVRLRCFHTDVLWFLHSKDRFHANPSWFSFKRTKDQIFSLHDPLPGITYSIQALLVYQKEMKKRKRRY
jgi:D-aspartate ligase